MASKVIATDVSLVEVNGTQHRVLVVDIQHLDTDSFTRSVDRAANNARKAHPFGRTVGHTAGRYAYHAWGRQCYSKIAYAESFDAAYAALAKSEAMGPV